LVSAPQPTDIPRTVANGYATEALDKLHTLKILAAEKLETNKYDGFYLTQGLCHIRWGDCYL